MGNKKPRNFSKNGRGKFPQSRSDSMGQAVKQLPNYHRFGRHLCDMPLEVGSFNPVGCPENAGGRGESS